MRKNTKLKAFTLSEVLITLGIIGVVAAITIPSLIQEYKRTEYSSKLKKFYSIMNQAILFSEQNNGDAGSWMSEKGINGDLKNDDGDIDYDANADVIKNFVDTYLAPYLKIISFQKSSAGDESYKGEAHIVLSDGSIVYIHNGNCFDFIFDVNGTKAPNTDGRDIYRFTLCPAEKCEIDTSYTGQCGKFTHIGSKSSNREAALQTCQKTPRKCSGVLLMDNFEFKKDYPYRL